MEIFQSIYYERCTKYLRFHGQWPYQSTRNRIFNLTLLMFATATIFVPQVIKLYEIRKNSSLVLLAVPSILFYSQYFMKNIFCALKTKEIRRVLEKIQYDFETFKNEDLDIIRKYSLRAYRYNRCYTIYMFMAVAAYSLLPLTLHTLDTFFPTNETRLPDKPRLIRYHIKAFEENNFLIISHGITVDILAIVFIIGFDTLNFGVSYHICAIFIVITNRIRASIYASKVDDVLGISLENRDQVFQNISHAIKTHQDALQYVQTLESAFSTLNLLSIGCAMIPLTLTGYQVVTHQGNFSEMFRFVLFALGEIVHLFYYNWPGQEIRDHSLLVYQSCYDCEWYREGISDKSKKLIKLMIVRSQRPCELTAGKLHILGLENFAAIIKMSMSYFTVLSSVA